MKQYTLHPFQRDLLRAAWIAMFKTGHQSVLLQLPTGGGKTIISAEFIGACIQRFEWESMFFAHRREIIHQSASKLAQADLMPGIIMAGEMYQPSRKVQVASIQSYVSWVERGRIGIHKPDLIVQDEAHSGLGKQNVAVIKAALADGCKLLGLTATPINKAGMGLASLYEVMICGPQVQWMIDNDFLVPVNYFMGIQPDVSGLKINGGDYSEKDLEKVVNSEALVGDILDSWYEHSAGRPTLGFAASVAHSMHLTQLFTNAGLRAIHIDGTTDKGVRDKANIALGNGGLDALFNFGTHVEGTDIPPIECIIDACPTASLKSFIQKGGRGFRTSVPTGKKDLNYHDHSGNVMLRHGRLEMHREWRLTNGRENIDMNAKMMKAQIIERVCTNCGGYFKGNICLWCKEPWKRTSEEMEIIPSALERMTYAELDEHFAKKHMAKKAASESIEQQRFYLECRGWCEAHGKKDGFAFHAFSDKYHTKPSRSWQDMPPAPPSGTTESYMRSRLIKAAKGFAKSRIETVGRKA